MIKRTTILLAFLGLFGCGDRDTTFGKKYNAIRVKYGSPIIHDYMELEIADEGFEHWRTPLDIHDTIQIGFHAGKGFYINEDSVLQEDDIFRKRIDDSTFAFIGILTYGNLAKNKFTSIYYDSVDARQLKLKALEYLDSEKKYRDFNFNTARKLTISEADSILESWGTSRFE